MHFDKFISMSESNNTGVWMEASGDFWGRSSDAAATLQLFYPKNRHF